MFIRLTESMSGGDTRVIILNTVDVMHIQEGMNGKDTHIRMNKLSDGGKMIYYFVKEKAADIWLMMNIDYTKAPVIMTADEALKYYAARNDST